MKAGRRAQLSRPFLIVSVLACCAALPRFASAQGADTPVRNEYRVTLVTTRPAAERERVIFFQYLGVVDSADKGVTSFYYSPPGMIVKPKAWAEIWVGMFGIYTDSKEKDTNWELRPLVGGNCTCRTTRR